jgi:hypothetical protein
MGTELNNKIALAQDALQVYSNSIQDVDNFGDLPGIDHNPFTCLLTSIVKIENKVLGAMNGIGAVEYTDPSTGEVMTADQNKIFSTKIPVDSDKFTKIYHKQLKEMFSLTYPALKVYGYFIKEIQDNKNADFVYFSIKDCMEFCGYSSHVMVYRGLTELVKKLFICKTNKPPQFWVNPLYAFNGDRIIIYKEYIKQDYFESETNKLQKLNAYENR